MILSGLLGGWTAGGGGGAPWGPANAARLTSALGRLGAAPGCATPVRSRIAHTLARRIGDPVAVSAIVDILAAPPPSFPPSSSLEPRGRGKEVVSRFSCPASPGRDGSLPEEEAESLDRLAGTLALKILRTLAESAEMTSEDREFWLSALGRLGRRSRLSVRGGGEDRLRERMVEALAAGMRGGVSVCRRRLSELRERGVLRGRALARAEEELSRSGQLVRTRSHCGAQW